MNGRDPISKRHGRAVVLALVAALAFASLGGAIFFVARAGAMIAIGDCDGMECEEGGGGGGDGGFGDGGAEEDGGLSPEEEEGIEIETGTGGKEGGGLTPEEEESIEIESGDDGKTPQEREEAAEERMKHEEDEQAKADEEFEKEWREEIEEEEKEKKTIAQRQQDRIEELEKTRKEELTCRNLQGQAFRDCLTSYPSADVEGLRRRCQQEGADLRREQRRGRAGGMQETELELCFSELIESSTIEHCSEISAERETTRGSGQPTISVDNELISCLETRGVERQAAMETARKLRELQEHKKGRKTHRARARH